MGIADVIFGEYYPSGRLPITIYPTQYVDDIPMTVCYVCVCVLNMREHQRERERERVGEERGKEIERRNAIDCCN